MKFYSQTIFYSSDSDDEQVHLPIKLIDLNTDILTQNHKIVWHFRIETKRTKICCFRLSEIQFHIYNNKWNEPAGDELFSLCFSFIFRCIIL